MPLNLLKKRFCQVYIYKFWRWTQVVHGCRQLVSWDVGLSPATSATLVFSCFNKLCSSKFKNFSKPVIPDLTFKFSKEKETKKTAGDKPEEGEDDVKSACPLCPGRHTCYNGQDNEMPPRESSLISKTWSQFGLQAATRLHEVGIASNRWSAIQRWIRSRALYTPPVTLPKSAWPKVVTLTCKGEERLRQGR